jgi:hypothetical protein
MVDDWLDGDAILREMRQERQLKRHSGGWKNRTRITAGRKV